MKEMKEIKQKKISLHTNPFDFNNNKNNKIKIK